MIYNTLRAANIARAREWHGPRRRLSLSFRGNELAGETGEACNIIKKLERARLGLAGSKTNLKRLAEELADVIICADLIAMDMKIDLVTAIERKFNKTSRQRGFETRLCVGGEDESRRRSIQRRPTRGADRPGRSAPIRRGDRQYRDAVSN